MTTVKVYGTAWCEVTRELRLYLQGKGVAHSFTNVENDASDEAAALTLHDGRYETPVVLVGERAIKNPAHSVLERELVKQAVLKA